MLALDPLASTMFSHSGESSSVTTSPGPSTAGSMVPLPALSLSCDPSAFWLSSVLLRSLTLVLSASISDRSEFTFFTRCSTSSAVSLLTTTERLTRRLVDSRNPENSSTRNAATPAAFDRFALCFPVCFAIRAFPNLPESAGFH